MKRRLYRRLYSGYGQSTRLGKVVNWGSLALALVVMISCIWFLTAKWAPMNRDVTAIALRAQSAGSADDTIRYLDELQVGYAKHEMTGHFALVYKTKYNDISEVNKTIDSVRKRLILIQGMDKSTTTYQVAMQDVRGTLTALNNAPVGAYLWTWYWYLYLLAGLIWIVPLVFLVIKLNIFLKKGLALITRGPFSFQAYSQPYSNSYTNF
jgi:hypothetical protein